METHVNIQYKTVAATIVGVIVANCAVLFRLIARRVGRISLTADDFLIIVALVFHWGIAVGGIIMLSNGMGLPLSSSSPHQLAVLSKTQYSGGFTYPICITFTKLSILMTYLRVFQRPSTRQQVFAVSAITVAWCAAICATSAVTCIPVAKVWTPNLPGRCINLTALYYGLQIPNILTDLMLLLIPMKPISDLNIRSAQKRGLYITFGLGALTLLFATIRLVYMIQYNFASKSTDATLAMVDATVWTCIEPAVGILAACLTNMRPLLRFITRTPPDAQRIVSDDCAHPQENKACILPYAEHQPH